MHLFSSTLFKALLSTSFELPSKGNLSKFVLISIAEDKVRQEFLESVQLLVKMGYNLAGTPGTAEYYFQFGVIMKPLDKPTDESVEKLPPNGVIAWIRDKRIDLIINIPEGTSRTDEVTGGYLMRRAAVDFGCSLLTNIKCAVLFCDALHRNRVLPCKSSEYYTGAAMEGYF